MFEAEIKEGEPQLGETNHIILATSQPVSYSTWDLGFLIDIVNKSYLSEFLAVIEKDVNVLKRAIKRNAEKIYSSIETVDNSLRSTKLTRNI